MKDLKARYLAAVGYVLANDETAAEAFDRLQRDATTRDAFSEPRDTQSFLDTCAEVVLAHEANITVHPPAPNTAEADLAALLELAAYYQDDYSLKLPVIAAFRHWRGGGMTAEEFLARLLKDDLADILREEEVPPMRGLTLLNDHLHVTRHQPAEETP